jgi:Spy/CpxP family protein refolding chaperone
MNTAARTPQRPSGLVLVSATALLALAAAVIPLQAEAAPATAPATTPADASATASAASAPTGRPAPRDHQGPGPARAMHAKHHGEPGGPAGMLGGRPLQAMLDHAKATPEQRTQIEALMQKARQDLQSQREAGRSTHLQLMQALAAPTVDARAIEALRKQGLAQHDQASQRMTQALVDAAKLLTPEQRASVAQHLASVAERPRGEHRMPPGAGRPGHPNPPATH